jgi:hypothetical protein
MVLKSVPHHTDIDQERRMSRTISGTYTSTVTLTSASDNPISVTGSITAAAGYGLYGIGGELNAWTITNFGVIVGGSNDSTGIALGGGMDRRDRRAMSESTRPA